MKILAIPASNSRKSINRQLLTYAATLLDGHAVELLDINDFPLPIYGEDLEAEQGIPKAAHDFLAKIAEFDALLISFAEHNGGYAVAYKNLFDWATRINRDVYQNKPVVMLATSPGPGGASSVLGSAVNSAHFFSGEVLASLSVPNFYDNFDTDAGRLHEGELNDQLRDTLAYLDELAVV
ncbi:NAD(P)H-dependent FMN reductase [Litorivivens lipolytica]|uniref:NAD(P)H-dependent FMN reductase n=1 Tax=Litorivivens lipolytica TaxID=1524264 RepID=A0A7W4Z6I2_9GAMM|nr:NAD(P)H-dependent oxidoreductase [Litorivivens lipolytica]MBB3048242.1 NAD(P)H-dependent FMN reductase [Litorivivens lipolytica]